MCTFFGLAQIILSTADDYVVSVLNEVFYQIFQIQQTWTAMYQCNIVHTKRCLQHCHLVELVEYNAGICITFYINNDTHTFTVGFVISIGNTFNFLFVGQIGYILNQFSFVDTIGNFCHNDFIVRRTSLNFGSSTHYDTSASREIGFANTAHTVYIASGREIRSFDIRHQLFYIDVIVFNVCNTSVNNLR